MRILTQEHLKNWQEIDPDNWQTIVGDIYELFMTREQKKFSEIIEAWKVRDLDKVSRVAHSLKSSCGNVGAEKAHSILHEVEHFSRHKRIVELKRSLSKLEDTFPATILAVASQMEKLQAA